MHGEGVFNVAEFRINPDGARTEHRIRLEHPLSMHGEGAGG
jgi:hypothetical protein